MEQLIIILILIIVGYVAGSMAESKHYRSIQEREKKWLALPAVTLRHVTEKEREIARVELVSGNVVISLDYFKRILAALRMMVGGKVSAYETLIDRARREAILRMKEAANGSDIILNVRIETAVIGRNANRNGVIGSVEAIAYGTAITYKN